MADPVCPECGSVKIRRSHTRGFSEKFLRMLGWRAFRCNEASCNWRGLIKSKSFGQAILSELKKRGITTVRLLIFTIVAIIALMLYFGIK
jgi:predicted RNA-binding Zn-ribbon protein involved in translation (DUF1610 family)